MDLKKNILSEEQEASVVGGSKASTHTMAIDTRICTGCGQCVSACSRNAIHYYTFYMVDADRCDVCRCCIPSCPAGALYEVRH